FTIFQPVQLLWINLITDCFPALALGMEKPEADVMKRAPRDSKEGIFAGGLGAAVVYQGALVTIITLVSYFVGHYLEAGNFDVHLESVHGTTMAFLTLAMCEVFHSFNMRSLRGSIFTLKGQNKWLWGAGLLSLVLTSVVVLIPAIAEVFGMVALGWQEYLIAMALGFCIIPLVEIVKLVHRIIDKKRGIEHS
ncbi:MAG: cation transporting ATPase C-terminal domain-containing protein, partial [Clostridia bacterium]|nr:cation transporting ATPase C-terminal domain-containing protein [Clostridia bacterium]